MSIRRRVRKTFVMKHFVCLTLYCIILFCFEAGICLKCRTGSQQTDMQYQKVFKTCLKRHTAANSENNDSMSSDSSDNSNSDTSDNSSSNRDFQTMKNNHKNNSQDFWSLKDSQIKKDDFNNDDSHHHGNNTDREKACVVQCFFDEMNAVDEKGFPEKDLVIPLMNQDARDPELKDFIEESVIECFHYLETIKKDKCEFSLNLLKCFAEKGQQQCEDWEN